MLGRALHGQVVERSLTPEYGRMPTPENKGNHKTDPMAVTTRDRADRSISLIEAEAMIVFQLF